MGGEARSRKQERELLVRSLRGAGSSWVEVAKELRRSYRLNARAAFRYAHGWSQSWAADDSPLGEAYAADKAVRAYVAVDQPGRYREALDIAEASSIVVDVTRLTASSASQLIVQRVIEVRGLLTPWKRTKAVRELDECLAVYRAASGNGSTKRAYSR